MQHLESSPSTFINRMLGFHKINHTKFIVLANLLPPELAVTKIFDLKVQHHVTSHHITLPSHHHSIIVIPSHHHCITLSHHHRHNHHTITTFTITTFTIITMPDIIRDGKAAVFYAMLLFRLMRWSSPNTSHLHSTPLIIAPSHSSSAPSSRHDLSIQ